MSLEHISIRPMTTSDLPAIFEVEARAHSHPWPHVTFDHCMALGAHSWVILAESKKVIGYILMLMQADEYHVLNLGIDPDFQRQGFASRLLSHVISQARILRASCIILEVRVSNKQAIALYENRGFTKINVRRGYYDAETGCAEDAYVYRLKL